MAEICLYLHTHQPRRLRSNFSYFDIGKNTPYYDDEANYSYLKRIVEKSYQPTNELFSELIKRGEGKFKLSFSITGVLMEHLEEHFPEVIKAFKALADTGCVEFISETYYHSLACLYSSDEFLTQVYRQTKLLEKLFGQKAQTFRNTELAYSDGIARVIASQGFKGILTDGIDRILDKRAPHFLYQSAKGEIAVLLKDYRLSDDIAFRFSESSWEHWPLTADKFVSWVRELPSDALVNLFLDYETFGEHQWKETGIFEFLSKFVEFSLDDPDIRFVVPSEAIKEKKAAGVVRSPEVITWADTERDLSAWIGNRLQRNSIEELYALEPAVKATKDLNILSDWRYLQTSDHFYYMCTKWAADGDIHKYFNHYESPYDAFITYKNILQDMKYRLGLNA